MALVIGYSDQYWDLKTYLLLGDGANERPYPSFWTMFNDKARAHNTAMAWLVAGFSTRIIDLKMNERAWASDAPVLDGRYGTLQSVQAVHPEIKKFSMQVVPPDVPWPISPADFKTWLVSLSNRTPTWTGALPPASQQVSAQSISTPSSSILFDTISPEQRAIMNLEVEKPVTEGVQHIASGYNSDTALCGCQGHTEPDWPHNQPLKREVVYCDECLSIRSRCHEDYMRGWARMQSYHHVEMEQRSPEEILAADPPPILWEDEAPLTQAEPLN